MITVTYIGTQFDPTKFTSAREFVVTIDSEEVQDLIALKGQDVAYERVAIETALKIVSTLKEAFKDSCEDLTTK